MTTPVPRSQPSTMPVPVTELGPEPLAERLRIWVDLAQRSEAQPTLNYEGRKILLDVADRLIEISKDVNETIPRLRAELQDSDAIIDAFGRVSPQQYEKEIADLRSQLASARKALEATEAYLVPHSTRLTMLLSQESWSPRRSHIEGVRNALVSAENTLRAALTQPESKP